MGINKFFIIFIPFAPSVPVPSAPIAVSSCCSTSPISEVFLQIIWKVKTDDL